MPKLIYLITNKQCVILHKKGKIMADKILRVRVKMDIFKEYQKLCIDLNLSLPKQTEALIRHFVTITKENKPFIK